MPGNVRPLAAATELVTGDWAFRVPRGGDASSQLLRKALQLAILAPSNHNTQPWKLRLDGSGVDVLVDRSRRLAAADPHDRELTISCGALLHHVELALAGLGRSAHVTILPDGPDGERCGRVALGDPRAAPRAQRRLFDQVTRRHTNRRRFEARPVPSRLVAWLRQEAEAQGCWLHLVGPQERPALSELVAAGEVAQAVDAAFQRELSDWVDASRARSADGMVPGVFGAPRKPVDHSGGLTYWRTFEGRDGQPVPPEDLVGQSPALVVLGSEGDEPDGWLRSGMALSAVLLRARAAGVWASFLNQPVQVAAVRHQLAGSIDAPGPPQLLLRLGYGPDPGPTPRRPLDDVLAAA